VCVCVFTLCLFSLCFLKVIKVISIEYFFTIILNQFFVVIFIGIDIIIINIKKYQRINFFVSKKLKCFVINKI